MGGIAEEFMSPVVFLHCGKCQVIMLRTACGVDTARDNSGFLFVVYLFLLHLYFAIFWHDLFDMEPLD